MTAQVPSLGTAWLRTIQVVLKHEDTKESSRKTAWSKLLRASNSQLEMPPSFSPLLTLGSLVNMSLPVLPAVEHAGCL